MFLNTLKASLNPSQIYLDFKKVRPQTSVDNGKVLWCNLDEISCAANAIRCSFVELRFTSQFSHAMLSICHQFWCKQQCEWLGFVKGQLQLILCSIHFHLHTTVQKIGVIHFFFYIFLSHILNNTFLF